MKIILFCLVSSNEVWNDLTIASSSPVRSSPLFTGTESSEQEGTLCKVAKLMCCFLKLIGVQCLVSELVRFKPCSLSYLKSYNNESYSQCSDSVSGSGNDILCQLLWCHARFSNNLLLGMDPQTTFLFSSPSLRLCIILRRPMWLVHP